MQGFVCNQRVGKDNITVVLVMVEAGEYRPNSTSCRAESVAFPCSNTVSRKTILRD